MPDGGTGSPGAASLNVSYHVDILRRALGSTDSPMEALGSVKAKLQLATEIWKVSFVESGALKLVAEIFRANRADVSPTRTGCFASPAQTELIIKQQLLALECIELLLNSQVSCHHIHICTWQVTQHWRPYARHTHTHLHRTNPNLCTSLLTRYASPSSSPSSTPHETPQWQWRCRLITRAVVSVSPSCHFASYLSWHFTL